MGYAARQSVLAYGVPMTKTQRLRNCAEGFMGGLVEAGFPGPWRWAHHQWEGAFYSAWRNWAPATRNPKLFPTFKVGGGGGASSQARDMLWQLKSTSPFHDHDRAPLNRHPRGMTASEYLEIHVEGASAQEWQELAASFLAGMRRHDSND
ncbi:hypothetical protein GCM10027517_11840 [Phycicoccus ginsengisoli]